MKNQYQDYAEPYELNGKTIKTCEVIPSEFGRTNGTYLLFTFTDGTRQLIGAHGFPYPNPEPTEENMKKAIHFFSVQDITLKVEEEENKKRQYLKEEQKRKLEAFKRLQKELNIEKI